MVHDLGKVLENLKNYEKLRDITIFVSQKFNDLFAYIFFKMYGGQEDQDLKSRAEKVLEKEGLFLSEYSYFISNNFEALYQMCQMLGIERPSKEMVHPPCS